MDYEGCQIFELINHIVRGDAKAQALFVEELRSHVRALMEKYGPSGSVTAEFAQQLLSRARRNYEGYWRRDSEFGAWADKILQEEVEAACGRPG